MRNQSTVNFRVDDMEHCFHLVKNFECTATRTWSVVLKNAGTLLVIMLHCCHVVLAFLLLWCKAIRMKRME